MSISNQKHATEVRAQVTLVKCLALPSSLLTYPTYKLSRDVCEKGMCARQAYGLRAKSTPRFVYQLMHSSYVGLYRPSLSDISILLSVAGVSLSQALYCTRCVVSDHFNECEHTRAQHRAWHWSSSVWSYGRTIVDFNKTKSYVESRSHQLHRIVRSFLSILHWCC